VFFAFASSQNGIQARMETFLFVLAYINSIIQLRNFSKVFATEPNKFRRICLETFLVENGIADRVTVLDKSPHEVEKSDFQNEEVLF
jgi:hypothetical protein